jgi:hypothetical protein
MVFQYTRISNKMQRYTVYLYVETALHVSGGNSTHHQERISCTYRIWYLSHRYCYLSLSWKSWDRFACAVGGVRHPQHTQTGSNSSTIAADNGNDVTNTRCCRYSCMRSLWCVELPPETCRAVLILSFHKNLGNPIFPFSVGFPNCWNDFS